MFGDVPRVEPARALGVLRCAGAMARDGRAAAVFVRGVAGSGKTTLLDRARREYDGHEGAVLFATGGQNPFRGWFGVAVPDSDAGFAVLEELCRRATALLADGPLTVIFDDAHRCDPLVMRWVDFLLLRSSGLRLLVVLAYDPEARPTPPSRSRRRRHVTAARARPRRRRGARWW